MPSHWIPAAKALLLLSELSGGAIDGRTLRNRARAGTLRASARLLNIEGDSRGDVILKQGFWDWTRYSEPEERWDIGDFSATIDGLRHDAIGVAFDLGGLSEMLPHERRPDLARQVSVAGDPAWVTAKVARAFMYTELNAQPNRAGSLLLDQCRFGFVAARAVLRQQGTRPEPGQWIVEEREWSIPLWFWEAFTLPGSSSQDWERGIFAGNGRGPSGNCYIRLSGVHFSRASLYAMIADPSRADEAESAKSAPGGRPPAVFWDDLWCAVWGMIFRAELIPKRQADIEHAMLQWASANDHDLSESAARQRARKLFAEFESEGINSAK